MKVFLVRSTAFETERMENILSLQDKLDDINFVEAIYPQYQRIPFQKKIISLSQQRTGHRLKLGELGCLLSHRKAWSAVKTISSGSAEGFLILESDSLVINSDFLKEKFDSIHEQYDIFFWGAFDSRMQLLKSSCTAEGPYKTGIPFIKSVYCTYGYSVNGKAAEFLLKETNKVGYPCDYWKHKLVKTGLRIGGIKPCIIETDRRFNSLIQEKNSFLRQACNKLRDWIVDFKNKMISSIS